jgi:hypothetical protein
MLGRPAVVALLERRAAVRVAREPVTHRYLCERGVSAVLSADLAFLYPYGVPEAGGASAAPYRAVFLRSNNLNLEALRIEGGALVEGSRLIAESSGDRLVLATSDYRRDARGLAKAASRLGVPWVACRSVKELVGLVGGSSGVVSSVSPGHPCRGTRNLRRFSQTRATKCRG